MSLTITHSFTGGTKAKASEVNRNFQDVVAKFTSGAGGILNEDCSTSMALIGSKLSNVPGNRVPTDRIEDAAITTVKIAATQIGKDKLKVTEVTQAFSLTVGAVEFGLQAVMPSPALPEISAVFPISLTVDDAAVGGGGVTGIGVFVFKNTGGVPFYAVVYKTVASGTMTGTIRYRYLALT
jgi:hypothetical protein